MWRLFYDVFVVECFHLKTKGIYFCMIKKTRHNVKAKICYKWKRMKRKEIFRVIKLFANINLVKMQKVLNLIVWAVFSQTKKNHIWISEKPALHSHIKKVENYRFPQSFYKISSSIFSFPLTKVDKKSFLLSLRNKSIIANTKTNHLRNNISCSIVKRIMKSVKCILRKAPSIVMLDRYFTNMIFHLSYDNASESSSPFILLSFRYITTGAIYFMFHTLCFDFIKSNQGKFISFYHYAIEQHDSNKTLFQRRKASDVGDKNKNIPCVVSSTSDFFFMWHNKSARDR